MFISFLFAFNYSYQMNTKRQAIHEAQPGTVIGNIHFMKRSGSFFQCKVLLGAHKKEIEALCFGNCLIGDKIQIIEVTRPNDGIAYEALACTR